MPNRSARSAAVPWSTPLLTPARYHAWAQSTGTRSGLGASRRVEVGGVRAVDPARRDGQRLASLRRLAGMRAAVAARPKGPRIGADDEEARLSAAARHDVRHRARRQRLCRGGPAVEP